MNKKLIAINLGSENGIKESMPVAISPGVLLGRVVKALPKYSLIITIFDLLHHIANINEYITHIFDSEYLINTFLHGN